MAHEGHDHDHDHEHGDHEHHGHAHEHHGHAHEHHGHAHEHHDHTHEHHHAEAHAHHGHDDHEHPHAHDDTLAGPPLARGAGKGKVLFLDAFSGIAGDMTIAALADLGVPHAVVDEAVAAVGLTGFHLHRGHKHDSSIVASTFDVHVEGRQPERTLRSIDDMIAASSLAPDVKALARAIFRRLGEAEAAVHKMPIDDVHFHEVGAVDAIVDIVGSAASFVYLGAHVLASPLPTGRGFVKARHGILPLPAPAVVTCLRGIPTYEVPLDRELVTPTGAAIVATVAQGFVRWPSFAPERVGWGAGTQTLPDRPNLLRAVLGEPTTPTGPTTTDTTQATHVVLEANVDDMTGEVAAHAIEALLAAGALDAWASPITMKKGRPALCLSALATLDAEARITAALLTETTSIGVRRSPVSRTVRPRRTVTVSTVYGEIPVKISEGPYGPPQTKPEFDACARAAREHGVPVRAVIAAALARLP